MPSLIHNPPKSYQELIEKGRGRIAWIARTVEAESSVAASSSVLRVDLPERSTGASRIDLWCLRHPKRDPRISDACMGIRAVELQFPEELSAATLAEIRASGGGGEVPMFIDPMLKTLIVQFHDLAAPDRDLALRTHRAYAQFCPVDPDDYLSAPITMRELHGPEHHQRLTES